MERWAAELMPGAAGFLGTTSGFCDDGTFVALARFESAAAAQANSARPEQGAWWAETEKCFDGEVGFLDCADARTVLAGGSDEAGFVQIMQGRSPDVGRMHELLGRHPEKLHAARPEIIGGLLMDAGEGRYVDAFYFTDEAAAREGEKAEPPAEIRAELEEGMALMGQATYLDLHEPMLLSP
jgi:hypothetical protein